MTVGNQVASFKADLAQNGAAFVYEKYVATDVCAGFSGSNLSGLRQRIAKNFAISPASVHIVGSAKLGFTLKKKRNSERPRYSPFSDASDVDVAIVSDVVFDRVWKECLDYWHRSGYSESVGGWARSVEFRDYIFRGWMRPDMLPAAGRYSYRRDWFDFFQLLTSERAAGDFKIAAGLYREDHFLRTYQTILIDECSHELRIAR